MASATSNIDPRLLNDYEDDSPSVSVNTSTGASQSVQDKHSPALPQSSSTTQPTNATNVKTTSEISTTDTSSGDPEDIRNEFYYTVRQLIDSQVSVDNFPEADDEPDDDLEDDQDNVIDPDAVDEDVQDEFFKYQQHLQMVAATGPSQFESPPEDLDPEEVETDEQMFDTLMFMVTEYSLAHRPEEIVELAENSRLNPGANEFVPIGSIPTDQTTEDPSNTDANAQRS